jgi:predicted lipid-binding transport protein (Tim44 family)
MLLHLSRLVIVLVLSLLSIVMTVDLPGGRGGRGVGVLVVLGLVVAIVLVLARLMRMRQPDHPLARLAPELLLQRARALVSRARARSSVALHRRRRRARVREVELTALAAAADDERLAPERITAAADALLRLVYVAWDARDRKDLATLLSADLLRDWERVLDAHGSAGERHRTEILDGGRIDLVGLTADGSGGGTAIVLIEAELSVRIDRRGDDAVERGAPIAFPLHQYWTLSLDERPMIALAIEERAAGDHHLREPIAALAAGEPAGRAATRRSSA